MRTDLSKEAAMVDGEYIEDLIEGYYTIKTSGREALNAEIETSKIATRDGEIYRSSRYPRRTITIEFLLKGDNLPELRTKLIELNKLLSPSEKEFVFNDEEDKFYSGVPLLQNSVTDVSNGCIGKIQIECLKPYKYSVFEHDMEPSLDDGSTLYAEYRGTKPAKPIFEVTFASDCGFVAFFDEREHILQFGNPEEVDGTTSSINQTIFNTNFTV